MENIVGFISLGILVASNLILTAYHYGKISQSVRDLSRRVNRLEANKDRAAQ